MIWVLGSLAVLLIARALVRVSALAVAELSRISTALAAIDEAVNQERRAYQQLLADKNSAMVNRLIELLPKS